MNETLGQIAYRTYTTHRSQTVPTAKSLFAPFDQLPLAVQDAWNHTGDAVGAAAVERVRQLQQEKQQEASA